jgi:hypothetical protein
VVDLDFEDRVMTFGESTAGMVRINLGRLRALGFQTPPSLRPWAESLPDLSRYPIVHTDVVRALAVETSRMIIIVGNDVSPEVKDIVSQLPLELIERRFSGSPGTSIDVRDSEGSTQSFETVEQLRGYIDSQK